MLMRHGISSSAEGLKVTAQPDHPGPPEGSGSCPHCWATTDIANSSAIMAIAAAFPADGMPQLSRKVRLIFIACSLEVSVMQSLYFSGVKITNPGPVPMPFGEL